MFRDRGFRKQLEDEWALDRLEAALENALTHRGDSRGESEPQEGTGTGLAPEPSSLGPGVAIARGASVPRATRAAEQQNVAALLDEREVQSALPEG